MPLTVACVLSPGPTYNRSHVDRLEAMVSQYMSQPYRFVCVDDSPFPGFWAKVSLFQPGRFSGRVLYLDLDVTIIGSLDELAYFPYPFCAIRDYQYPLQINSSIMSWDAGVADNIYVDFTLDTMDRFNGDQNYLHTKVNAVTFPKHWVPSYKAHVLPTGQTPKDARVIVYHGSPRPWEVD